MAALPLITPGSISAMTGVADHPVYFVTLNNEANPSLTVKGEEPTTQMSVTGPATATKDAAASLQWGGKIMKNVNHASADTRPMSTQEITAFKQAARRLLASEPNKIASLDQANKVWVKMLYVQGLSDGNAELKNSAGKYEVKDAQLRALMVKFASKNIWFEMGKLAAADIFIGNRDRFTEEGDWANQGNLMFSAQVGGTKVLGLDSLDPASDHSNLNKTGSFPELRVLTEINRQRSFAEKATTSVGFWINRWMIKAEDVHGQPTNKFTYTVKGEDGTILRIERDKVGTFQAYVTDMMRGLDMGSRELKNYLVGKVNQYKVQNATVRQLPTPQVGLGQARMNAAVAAKNSARNQTLYKTIPQGVLDRMKYLNWI